MKLCLQCQQRLQGEGWQCVVCGYEPTVANGFTQFAPDLDDSDEGFDPTAFDALYATEERNFWFQSRNRLIIWAIRKYFPDAKSMLEIGCGTGFVLSNINSEISGLSCSGSEIHSTGLKFARSRIGDVPLLQMDARKIPFEAEFDLVGAFDVIEHIKEDEASLQQIFQAVRPGGGILLTVPQHPSLWSQADEKACHERRYTRRELRQKVECAGFEILRATSFVTLLLPLMAVSRLKEKFSDTESDAELELPPRINAALESVMKFESVLIRSGLSLPLGGSLLLAAKKPR